MEQAKPNVRQRVGVVSTDPLRVVGLEAILAGLMNLEVVQLVVPGAMDVANLALVLVDQDCTEHLFELLAAFRRRRPLLKLMVLGNDQDHGFIQRIIAAGAKGYLRQTATEDEVRLATEIVLDGSLWAPRKVLARLIATPPKGAAEAGAPPGVHDVTPREAQVLLLLKAGHPNRDIADVLGIDEATVKAHVGRLLRKAGVANRISLAVQAIHKDGTGSDSQG